MKRSRPVRRNYSLRKTTPRETTPCTRAECGSLSPINVIDLTVDDEQVANFDKILETIDLNFDEERKAEESEDDSSLTEEGSIDDLFIVEPKRKKLKVVDQYNADLKLDISIIKSYCAKIWAKLEQ